jgi:hypothetical protein
MTDDFFARLTEYLTPKTPAETSVAARVSNAEDGKVAPANVSATPLAPPGGAPWIRYVAIVAIVVVLIILYVRGYR